MFAAFVCLCVLMLSQMKHCAEKKQTQYFPLELKIERLSGKCATCQYVVFCSFVAAPALFIYAGSSSSMLLLLVAPVVHDR